MSAEAKPLGYTDAAIPEPYQILGLRLRPFCLGHYWLMERFGISFVATEDQMPALADLLFGMLICSMSYEDFLEFIDDADWETKVQEWGKKIGVFDLEERSALFSRYIAAALRQPMVVYEGETRDSGAHWSQAIFHGLTSNCGYTAQEARNLPLAQAFMDFYKVAESNGVVRILDEQTAELLRRAEAGETVSSPDFACPGPGTPSPAPVPAEPESELARHRDIFLKARSAVANQAPAYADATAGKMADGSQSSPEGLCRT